MKYERCFICEKPSMAREIAGGLQRKHRAERKDAEGHITVGKDVVTWFFGHMFQQAMPKDYGKRWANFGDVDALPVVIDGDAWLMNISPGKEKQVGLIRKLVGESALIVNGGDAGREGQLLIDEALHEWRIDPFGERVQRLWCRALTEAGVEEALSNLRPNVERRNLSMAALARSRADYQHGMTYSPLYTVLARRSGADAIISVGRVQTPTLRLVVNRDRERASFRPVNFYTPHITVQHANGSFRATWKMPDDTPGTDSEGRLLERGVAEGLAAKVLGKRGAIDQVGSDFRSEKPPLPYDLASFTSVCGTRLNLTAAQSLEVAQALYDKKLIPYPRTDSAYLPLSMLPEVPVIMEALSAIDELRDLCRAADTTLRSQAWNDAKIEDHYAIVPTTEFTAAKLASLSEVERQAMMFVARQFIMQFYPAHTFRAMSIDLNVEGEKFRATGRLVVEEGWRRLLSKSRVSSDRDEEGEQEEGEDATASLPAAQKGDAITVTGQDIQASATKPPPAFNDPRLAGKGGAMENAYLFETNPDIRKKLKDGAGIGRPATRAGIIELLLRRKFLRRKGKTGLESTELGQSVVDAVPDELSSVGLTALWETALERIESGQFSLEQFMEMQAKDLRMRVKAALEGPAIKIRGAGGGVKPLPGHGQPCPQCQQGTLITRPYRLKSNPAKTRAGLFCSRPREECGYADFDADIKPMDGHGETCSKCGVGRMMTREFPSKKKPGTKVRGLFCSNREHCDNVIFESTFKKLAGDGKECPSCHKGHMRTRSYKKDGVEKFFLGCDAYPSCRHSEFPDDKGAGKKSRK